MPDTKKNNNPPSAHNTLLLGIGILLIILFLAILLVLLFRSSVATSPTSPDDNAAYSNTTPTTSTTKGASEGNKPSEVDEDKTTVIFTNNGKGDSCTCPAPSNTPCPTNKVSDSQADKSKAQSPTIVTCTPTSDDIDVNAVIVRTGKITGVFPSQHAPSDVAKPDYYIYLYKPLPGEVQDLHQVSFFVSHCPELKDKDLTDTVIEFVGYYKWGYSENIDVYPLWIKIIGKESF